MSFLYHQPALGRNFSGEFENDFFVLLSEYVVFSTIRDRHVLVVGNQGNGSGLRCFGGLGPPDQ